MTTPEISSIFSPPTLSDDSKAFIRALESGQVPEKFPMQNADYYEELGSDAFFEASEESYRLRKACRSHGMYAIVDKTWTKELAKFLENQKVLEVMAGAGWLAAALAENGVDIVATDNHSWAHRHKALSTQNRPTVHPVVECNGIDAVKQYSADVLVVSWPTCNEEIVEICDQWGSDRPIVYIGEEEGGCTACDEFFEHFEHFKKVEIPKFLTIDDYMLIGYWKR